MKIERAMYLHRDSTKSALQTLQRAFQTLVSIYISALLLYSIDNIGAMPQVYTCANATPSDKRNGGG